MNMYSTMLLLQAVNKIMPVNGFLRSTFLPGISTSPTEEVLLDFKKGKRKMAPFVQPRSKGVSVDRSGYRTDKYAPPLVAPQRPITTDDLKIRSMGEGFMSLKSPADRQAELLGNDLAEFERMIARREEWMVSQMLFEGKITMHGYANSSDKNTKIDDIDYNFTNKVMLTDTYKWSAAAAEIYQNLWDWRMLVAKKSGVVPTVCLMGAGAAKLFRSNEDIQKKMNMYHGPMVSINPQIISPAATHLGYIPELGMDIMTYTDWAVNDIDPSKEDPFVPDNAVLLASPSMGNMHYGAVTQIDEGEQFITIEGARVPKSWADKEADVRMLRTSSRPIPIPRDVDDWLVARVF